MKILYHHRTQGRGVEAIHIMGVVNGLRGLGHDVSIVGPPRTNPENAGASPTMQNNKRRAAFWKAISTYMPEVLFEAFELIYGVLSYFRLLFVLRSKNVDIIYERYSLFQFGGVLLAKTKQIPILLEINDSALVDRVRDLKCKKLALLLEKKIFQQADALITISSCFRNKILSHGIEHNKIHIIPNAIDAAQFTGQQDESKEVKTAYGLENKFIVGFVGLFVPWHGILFLLDVFSELCNRYTSLHLLLVGDGPQREKIEEKLQHSNLTNCVTITGYIPHRRIRSFIQSFDVAVMPDSNDYGSPMKIFEYMATGKPIIAPNYSPIRDVLINNDNALLFEPRMGGELKSALETVIKDRNLRVKLGSNAKRDVLNRHTWRENAAKIISLIPAAPHFEAQPPGISDAIKKRSR